MTGEDFKTIAEGIAILAAVPASIIGAIAAVMGVLGIGHVKTLVNGHTDKIVNVTASATNAASISAAIMLDKASERAAQVLEAASAKAAQVLEEASAKAAQVLEAKK